MWDIAEVTLFVASKRIAAFWFLVNLRNLQWIPRNLPQNQTLLCGRANGPSVLSNRSHHREDRETRSDDLSLYVKYRKTSPPSLSSTLLLQREPPALKVELWLWLKHPKNICEDYRVFASPSLIVLTVCVAQRGEVQLEAWIRSFCCVGACRYCRQRAIVSVCVGRGPECTRCTPPAISLLFSNLQRAWWMRTQLIARCQLALIPPYKNEKLKTLVLPQWSQDTTEEKHGEYEQRMHND